MDPTTTLGALAIGLATSVHCAGMCGPIACGIGTMSRSEGERLASTSLYHLCRLGAYAVIGAICGSLGSIPLGWFFDSPAVLLPWALVVALVIVASGLDKRIPRPALLTRLTARARLRLRRLGPVTAAAAMGGLTPFLPCGPLYAVFIALMASGSAVHGAEAALAFGLGTVPLLWLAQSQFHRLRVRLTPRTMARIQRGLALTAAIVLAWRLHDTLPFPAAGAAEVPAELPSCCH